MRITKEILNNKLSYLNRLTEGKIKFGFNYAYGGVMLVKLGDHGGQTEISARCCNREMANILDTLTNTLIRLR